MLAVFLKRRVRDVRLLTYRLRNVYRQLLDAADYPYGLAGDGHRLLASPQFPDEVGGSALPGLHTVRL